MLNNVVLIGRLTKDPDLKFNSEGLGIANFTLAVDRTFSKKDEADFINIVAFKKTAENVANYLKKGSMCAVEGRIQTRNYENKEGNRVYVTEVIANNVRFLDSKKSETKNNQTTYNKKPEKNIKSFDSSDLPF